MQELHVDLIRATFLKSLDDAIVIRFNDDEKTIINKYRSYVMNDTKKQLVAVRGRDRLNRAIVLKFQRIAPMDVNDIDDVMAYKITNIYLAEKANAVTEISSLGMEEKSISVFDYANYNSSNLPPYQVVFDTITTLQAHYPERAYKVILSEPPFFLRTGYSMLRPFLSQATQEKVQMLSGFDAKQQALEDIIDIDQAMPFLLPDGQLTSEIDAEKVINQPFHFLYDDDGHHNLSELEEQ